MGKNNKLRRKGNKDTTLPVYVKCTVLRSMPIMHLILGREARRKVRGSLSIRFFSWESANYRLSATETSTKTRQTKSEWKTTVKSWRREKNKRRNKSTNSLTEHEVGQESLAWSLLWWWDDDGGWWLETSLLQRMSFLYHPSVQMKSQELRLEEGMADVSDLCPHDRDTSLDFCSVTSGERLKKERPGSATGRTEFDEEGPSTQSCCSPDSWSSCFIRPFLFLPHLLLLSATVEGKREPSLEPLVSPAQEEKSLTFFNSSRSNTCLFLPFMAWSSPSSSSVSHLFSQSLSL